MLLLRAYWTRFIDNISYKLAWLLPKKVVYWSYLRVVGNATSGKWSATKPDDLNWTHALDRWERGQ
jgi:hypothetical protein